MFHGSIVALVTPMLTNGVIDYAALDQLLDWHRQEKTHGLVISGSTGESATLTETDYRQLIKFVVANVKQHMPVIVGSGTNATHSTIAKTQLAMELGADACLIVTPYYNRPTQEGLFQHYSEVAKAVAIPQILYNVPSRTGCDLLPETVARLSNRANIVGIKEAIGHSERMEQLFKAVDGQIDIFSGDDPTALALFKKGAKGVISVAANVVPRLFSQMYEFYKAGKVDKAESIDIFLQPLYQALSLEPNPIPVKWMLQEMGLIQAGIRLPLTWLAASFHEEAKQALNLVNFKNPKNLGGICE